MVWLFTLNHCPTRDMLLSWGLSVQPKCLLCNAADESRDHLYFRCNYSWEIWSETATRCQFRASREWEDTITTLCNIRIPKTQKKLLLIAWQCSIYLIWSERNSRLHRNCFRPTTSIISSLDLLVRNRCSSLCEQNPQAASTMIQLWLG